MNKQAFLIFFLFLYCFSSLAEVKIKLNSTVDKALVSIEEEVKFTIMLTHAENENISIPDIGPLITGLEIKEFGDKAPELVKGMVLKEKWFKLKATLSGTYQLPSVEITHDNQLYKTSPIFVEFKDSNNSKNEPRQSDIRDIKDIYQSPPSYLWLIILAVLTVLGIGGGYFYKFHYRKIKPEKLIPAHDLAIRELLSIKDISFNSNETAKIFSFKLSEILRTYVEALINLNVTDQTTSEIKKNIFPVSAIEDHHKKAFIKILEETDIIKFTDHLPDNNHKEELYNLAIQLVEDTKPKQTEVSEDLV